ncbi:hypothetical protein QBC32DRAFT_268711 [Pseudoneurospora amorphoporcata]|uniref:Glucose-methanol-choline oxidoreductase N-terminal domain-containing protein n=1 Tax=Pseudoneurospora amorphoporcata TaxID=241081 RepID=A0AAN6SD26_9PEZI|nr:hypothetical protein QBC32DRAFT_268711 [Pseudoneurospora amorphoporcata]
MAKLSKVVFLWKLLSIPLATAYPQLQNELKQRAIKPAEVKGSYDYVIIGGGQSGLVVANRLSEDPKVSVLVVEYGYFDDSYDVLDIQQVFRSTTHTKYNLTSVPQTQLGERNQVQGVPAAAVVGGGSAINGMFFNRGSADDYDNWEKLGNPGWGFKGLLPYFIKSTTLQIPDAEFAKEFNVTWDEKVYGKNGPIQASIYPVQYPALKSVWTGFEELGAERQKTGDDGNAHGLFWATRSIDDRTRTRSYARTGYYAPVADRKNLDLLTGWRANTITFDKNKQATGINMQSRDSITDAKANITSIKARKEVILAAGALHTPQILQRSGVGPATLLQKANIPVLVDLPGVGSNMQDHPQVTMIVALLPLSLVSPSNYTTLAKSYLSQSSSAYLPTSYTAAQKAGYAKQQQLLGSSLLRKDNSAIEIPFAGNGGYYLLMLTKPLSRGTITLDPANPYAEPLVDYNTFGNPVDLSIATEAFKFGRALHGTKAVSSTFNPVEVSPGVQVATEKDLQRTARDTVVSTTAHLSGTAALMPRELGGVVDAELRVYGVQGVRVVDSSVMPLIPGAHLCSTVYAVAEKAADVIRGRNLSELWKWEEKERI